MTNSDPNSPDSQSPSANDASQKSSTSGPLSLARIREMRAKQKAAEAEAAADAKKSSSNGRENATVAAVSSELSSEASNVANQPPQSPAQPATADTADTGNDVSKTKKTASQSQPVRAATPPGVQESLTAEAQRKSAAKAKVSVPNLRQPLSDDLQNELESALGGEDFDGLLVGDRQLKVGRQLDENTRYQGTIVKIHNEDVFVSLGGPDEGVLPLLHFNDMPAIGQEVECIIRGYNEDGLYDLAIPGEAVSAADWSDIDEGNVVEAVVESSNTGGLECKVGAIRAFMPMSQIADYRVETPADFVGQKLLTVVTEANPRKGNLVISHRAILEREKEAKRKERLDAIEPGDVAEGIVRKVMDFGAFVDIGGLDGLIHISQLSWDHVKHPSEVVSEGDEVQVKIEKIDKATGKIALSYRALQDHPWENAESRFSPGSVVKGTVTRIATFGAFVKLDTGIEGLIHISELSNKRVSAVSQVVSEGEDVEVKVLTFDKEAQRIGLSIKQVREPAKEESEQEPEAEEPPRKPAIPPRSGPLKGGHGGNNGGEQFGLRLG